jgi:hypothetical protein
MLWQRVGCCCSLRETSFRCARHGRRAWLLWRKGELQSRSQGGLETPYSAELRYFTALGFLLRVGVLCSVVAGGDSPNPPTPQRLA